MFVEYGKKQKDKQSDLNFWHLIPLTLSTSEDLYQISKKIVIFIMRRERMKRNLKNITQQETHNNWHVYAWHVIAYECNLKLHL